MEKRIQKWLKKLHRQRLESGQIAELEAHLRDTIDELLIKGFSEEEAFTQAEQRVGNLKSIARQEWNVNGKKERKSMMPAFVPMYFTQAWRQLRRNRVSTFITLSGLVAGLTACILLAIYVKFENSYDEFHRNPQQVYRLVNFYNSDPGTNAEPLSFENFAWNIMDKVPGVVEATGVQTFLLNADFNDGFDKSFTLDMIAVDSTFNHLFNFPMIDGQKMRLDKPGTVYITQASAKKLFGNDDPIGKTINSTTWNLDFEIIGVLEDLPGNTHFKFDMVTPSLGERLEENTGLPIRWGPLRSVVYMRLADDTHPDSVAKAITAFSENMPFYEDRFVLLQSLSGVHLSDFENPFKLTGDSKTTRIFSFIAIIILAIACINTMMISFSEYLKRIREIGIRKVLGADNSSIASLFLAEHVIKLMIAISGSLLLSWLLIPWINSVMDRNIAQNLFLYIDTISIPLSIITVVILITGVLPALLIFRNHSRNSLSGIYQSGVFTRYIRQGTIALQFGMTIFLMIYLYGINSQLKFIQNHDVGYDPENLLIVKTSAVMQHINAFHNEIVSIPEVTSASLTSWHPRSSSRTLLDSTTNRTIQIHQFSADPHILTTLGLRLIEGEDFNNSMPAPEYFGSGIALNDDGTQTMTPQNPLLVTKSFLRLRNIQEPAIGTYHFNPIGRIVGVFPDYHHGSLHHYSGAIVFVNSSSKHRQVLIRFEHGAESTLLPKLQEIHRQISGGFPMSYEFVEDTLAAFYDADRRQTRLVAMAIGVALSLSLMGLFGIVAFNLERRTKEIGIRKILGADVPRLIWLLTRDVYALVAVGTILSAPFALKLLNTWLEQYAYRIEPGIELVLLALLVTSIIVAVLVIWQAGRAALENPVKALRSE